MAPRSALARRAASHAGIFLALSAVYAVLIGATFAGGGGGGLDYDSVRKALSESPGFLAGWTHYVVVDLFVGAWIVRESGRIGVEPRPYVLFAMLLCPLGLGAFLVRRTLRLRSLGQLGEADLV